MLRTSSDGFVLDFDANAVAYQCVARRVCLKLAEPEDARDGSGIPLPDKWCVKRRHHSIMYKARARVITHGYANSLQVVFALRCL